MTITAPAPVPQGITLDQLDEIRQALTCGESQQKIADRVGVTQTLVSSIARGRRVRVIDFAYLDLPTDYDYAWAAGLFEGEGCLNVSRRGNYVYPQILLGMTDEDVVRRFASIIRARVYVDDMRNEYCKDGSSRKTIYRCHRLGWEFFEWFATTIGVYFGERRQARIEEVRCLRRSE